MGRIETFKKYLLWIVGFYIFTMVLTYIGLNATYKNINLKESLPNQVTINLAQATTVNGRIYGEITSTEQNNLEGKYIKAQIYNKKGKLQGTKYLKIENIKINETKKFEVYFTSENIEYYTIEILDDTAQTREDVIKVAELFKDTFTNEELKTYAVVTLILALIFI